MDSLSQAAEEAEDILNRAKSYNCDLLDFESNSQEKMTWSNDKLHVSDSGDDSRLRHLHRNSFGVSAKESNGHRFDIFQKLRELYDELSTDESLKSNYQGLKTTSYLLEKLLARINLNTLIINLYPGNKGYSISLRVNGNTQYLQPPDGSNTLHEETLLETARWPYEEEDLLSYIDNEELPVVLLDLLETEHSNLFYSGCIIAQIRDYRQAYPNFLCDTHHVLLKPTTQSVITDANILGARTGCTLDERTMLESQLVLATSPLLCLDPRPAVGLLAAKLSNSSRMFNTPNIRRQAKKFSQVAVNRKRKLDQLTHHHGLELLDVINKYRAKQSRHPQQHSRVSSKFPKKPADVLKPIEAPKMEMIPLAVPSEPGAALRLARAYERPQHSQLSQHSQHSPNFLPQLVEEYVLESEKSNASGYFHIKLSILQRPSDQEYLGELYVDRDYIEGQKNGAACRFPLGTRLHANKYIQQFTEIFTEEGRKSVRIKHLVPGQAPRVSVTMGMKETETPQQAVQAPATQSTHVSATVTVSSGTSSSGVVTHTPARSLPILHAQLQLQLQSQSSSAQSSATSAASGSPRASLSHAKLPEALAAADSLHAKLPEALAATGSLHAKLPDSAQIRTPTQVHEIQTPLQSASASTSANQMLTQQLINPPQPLNPKPIINLQHQHTSHLMTQNKIHVAQGSQSPNIQLSGQYTVSSPANIQQPQNVTVAKPRTTNPAISALVTSLMNSAQQFQQQAANAGAKCNNSPSSSSSSSSSSSNNATILNLLNSAPAAMTHAGTTHAGHELDTHTLHNTLLHRSGTLPGARIVAASPVTTSAQLPHTYTQLTQVSQVMTGYSAVPVSSVSKVITSTAHRMKTEPQSDNVPSLLTGGVESGNSTLLERLMAPSSSSTSSSPAHPNSPASGSNSQAGNLTPLHVQGLSLANLQSIPGLQNVQVQIPGLAQPISLSLNVSAAGGASAGLLVSVPSTSASPSSHPHQQTIVLNSQGGGNPTVLSLPLAQLMSSGMKTISTTARGAGPTLQLMGTVGGVGGAGGVSGPRARPVASRAARPSLSRGKPQVTTQFVAHQQQLNHQARRKSNPDGTQ